MNRQLSNVHFIDSLIDSNGVSINNEEVISNVFNDYFASVFSPSHSTNIRSLKDNQDNPISKSGLATIHITNKDVSDVLKIISPCTSIDPNNLSYKILKEGGDFLASCLAQLFALSLLIVVDYQ